MAHRAAHFASLEEKIPESHPVRLLDEILEGLDWTAWESKYSGKLGQPPIHPGILCKVLLSAMIRRIRSSRSIEYQIEHSVDFMWLVSGRTIDHSTIRDFRREQWCASKSDPTKNAHRLTTNFETFRLGRTRKSALSRQPAGQPRLPINP